MLPFSLRETDANSINNERKTQKSRLIRDRMNVLYLLHLGYSRQQAADIVGCHANTVTNYIKMYNSGGLDEVRRLNYSYSRHALHPVYKQVDEALHACKCATVSEASEVLRSGFGYNRSKEAVRHLLHQLGYKHRKTGTFPGKIDNFDAWQARQQDYIGKLRALGVQANARALDLVFGDAAHFVYGKFSSFRWSKYPIYQPSGHGRYRINVYGAYDLRTNQVHTMYNEGYIDAEFMVSYLEWLRAECYPIQERPLHIVLDNARYQHCSYVKQCAHRLNVVLEFLPAYSPNLNITVRLWKYLKAILGKQ
ncbi:IS630 family transposase [Catalinimonas sp. 4WD22]|uniref:IS630 family transposase n=1 Tax=Catalinimonas locisalis TaxID=3133978 RepID=UPI003101B195